MSAGSSSSPIQPQLVLAFDYGTRRIGIASGDTLTMTARPLATLECSSEIPWADIAKLIQDYSPHKLVVGLPYNMDGSETVLTPHARGFARKLEKRFGIAVALVDERQSSRDAERELRDARADGSKRRRVTHADVDKTAAKILLERWFQSGMQR